MVGDKERLIRHFLNAKIFYEEIISKISGNSEKFQKDIWRCNYAISKLNYMIDLIVAEESIGKEKSEEILSVYNAMNKGIEQFRDSTINKNHIKLNEELFRVLTTLPPHGANL